MPISKTDFVRGLQCEKMLWLDAHAPELKIIPAEVQARLDAGNEFGDKAMSVFGDFVETTVFKEDGRLNYAAMLEKTKELLERGENVICEAAFSWYGNYCAADILKKDGDGYALYEVKNAPAARKEFIVDLGFQRLILRKCGVKITTCSLLLNADKQDEREGQVCDEIIEHGGSRFKIAEVTRAARIEERVAEKRIFELGKLKRKDAPLPLISVGGQCESPYRCWYYEHCHKKSE
ncbi:MAG: hypothetical protein IJX91_04420 [Clostridia bacterium]|nr:hypothetical protein [Clostridia bacterium]